MTVLCGSVRELGFFKNSLRWRVPPPARSWGSAPGAAFLETHDHFTRIDFISTGNVNVGRFLAAALGYRLRF